jgi:hypothetical protein
MPPSEDDIGTTPVATSSGGLELHVSLAGRKRILPLPNAGSVTIGRSPSAEVQTDDRSVSRRHAVLRDAALQAHQAGRQDRERVADERARNLEPRLPRLVLVVRSIDGLEITRDGRPVPAGAFGTSLPVDPGEHRVEAKRLPTR